MSKAIDEYLSPPRKIIAMLKKGRDRLRVKYRELMEQRRVAENQVRAVEKSRELWRARAETAEAALRELKKDEPRPINALDRIENSDTRNLASTAIHGELLDAPKIPGSRFSIGLVMLVLRMVIEGAVSMRAASRISGLICEFVGGHRFDGLSHATVQNYLLRVGLDQISNVSDNACPDRVWIMDHMIAAGSLKCFIVLKEISGRVGVPLAILSDRGSDLKKGVELFQQDHPETISLYDIVHLASRLIWKRLGKEDRFSQYRQACCRCANQLRQTSLAHLKPPRPKTKARYMNLDPEIRWGRRALWLLDRVRSGDLTARQKERLKLESVEAQLGWIAEYREELGVWAQLCEAGQTSCTVVRRCGYSRETVSELKATLGTSKTVAVQEMITELTLVVEQQCARCERFPERLPGSSEVIESLIGKGKRLLGTSQNNNSLTGQILSIAASTVKFSATSLVESLSRCRIGHVQAWLKEHIHSAVHVARREDLTEPEFGIKIAQAKAATTPNF